MAFADPQSVTVNAVAQSLARVGTTENKGIFRKDDGSYVLTVSHSTAPGQQGAVRHLIRLDNTKTATDPLTAQTARVKTAAYLVIDEPQFGYTAAEIKDIVLGFAGWLTSANVLKVVGREV